MSTCKVCGEDLVGDGYTLIRHCPNADISMGYEPDANIVYCDLAETPPNPKAPSWLN